MNVVRLVCFAALFFTLCPALPVQAFNVNADNQINIGINPNQVETLLGGDDINSPMAVAQTQRRMLNHLSIIVTKALGYNNPEWNKTNPKWYIVYEKVYADIEEDMQPKGGNEKLIVKEIKDNIAQNMDRDDAAVVLAFYKSGEGKRYLEFNKRMNQILLDGVDELIGAKPDDDNAGMPFAPDQVVQYRRMIKASISYRTAKSYLATLTNVRSLCVCGMMLDLKVDAIIKQKPKEIRALYQKYGNDMHRFVVFNESAAEEDLIETVIRAIGGQKNKIKGVSSDFPMHVVEWRVLYKKEINGE